MYTIKYDGSLTGVFKTKDEATKYAEDNFLINAEVVKIDGHSKLNTHCKDLNKLTSAIKLWSAERNLHTQDYKMQTLKVVEEVDELFRAIVTNDEAQNIDAVGDTYVTLVILCQQLGIEMTDCVNVAYGEIKDRKEKLVGGTFIKEVAE